MPSDPRVLALQQALAAPHERFRNAVLLAAEQMREYLRTHAAPEAGTAAAPVDELGRFAAGRIDAGRFASLFHDSRALTSEVTWPIERALATLTDLLAEGDGIFTYALPTGGELRRGVDELLASIGRAFGAALVFQAARLGTFHAEQHNGLLVSCPFGLWNRAERALAPPVIVSLDGVDLRGERLVGFLDGRMKLVLVTDGPCAPAPLVRLLTPHVFVQQAATVAELERFLAWEGAGVAALVPESAARFTHDPGAGSTLPERLTIAHLPGEPPKHALGARSAWQQREELEQLAALGSLAAKVKHVVPVELDAVSPAASRLASAASVASAGGAVLAPAPTMPAAGADAVDTLTAWLLAQAGFEPAASAGGTAS